MPYARELQLGAGQPYTLKAINKSTNSGSFCVFQQDPDLGVSDVMSLAWFSKFVYTQTNVDFKWTIDYDFVWAQTGSLAPGVVFDASQAFSADLQTGNQITLDYTAGAYQFLNQGPGPHPGILYIKEDATIPLKQAAVGIGMSGFGTFVVQAQPNLNLNFTPHPKYYIVFGNYIQGEVLDISEMTNVAEIQFGPGIYSVTATLNQDNSWTVSSTVAVNQALVKGRLSNPELSFADATSLVGGKGGSITKVVVRNAAGQSVFKGEPTASVKGTDIFVTTVYGTKIDLDSDEVYTITGKSGSNDYGPVQAKYMSKSGNTYKFTEE